MMCSHSSMLHDTKLKRNIEFCSAAGNHCQQLADVIGERIWFLRNLSFVLGIIYTFLQKGRMQLEVLSFNGHGWGGCLTIGDQMNGFPTFGRFVALPYYSLFLLLLPHWKRASFLESYEHFHSYYYQSCFFAFVCRYYYMS